MGEREAQMNREAMTVIAELMWALRRLGAHTFFPGMPLHKARKLVLWVPRWASRT